MSKVSNILKIADKGTDVLGIVSGAFILVMCVPKLWKAAKIENEKRRNDALERAKYESTFSEDAEKKFDDVCHAKSMKDYIVTGTVAGIGISGITIGISNLRNK